MKKLASLILAVAMLLTMSFGFAEDEEIIAGIIPVYLEDIGMFFLVPGDMEQVTEGLSEEVIFAAGDEDLLIALSTYDAAELTADDIIASLEALGYNVEINPYAEAGLEFGHIAAEDPEDPSYASVYFLGIDDCWYEFTAQILTEDGVETFGFILVSLSPIEEVLDEEVAA